MCLGGRLSNSPSAVPRLHRVAGAVAALGLSLRFSRATEQLDTKLWFAEIHLNLTQLYLIGFNSYVARGCRLGQLCHPSRPRCAPGSGARSYLSFTARPPLT